MSDITALGYKEKDPGELALNPFEKIGKEWMLVTSGDESGFNTMTASWGFMGVIWGKPSAEIVIRPQRYTKEFLDKNELFTLSFYDESYRKALALCGSVSGRDTDKARDAGLTPLFTDGTAAFEEAKLILVCKKLYAQPLSGEFFTERDLDGANYAAGDYHTAFIGEIIKVYEK